MDIEVLEALALSEDRNAALAQLIPATEDYFFYHCLHYQASGRFDEVARLLETWINQHGRTSRVSEIENRQALLTYKVNPKASLQYLTEKLGLRFDDQREMERKTTRHPSRLDHKLIARLALTSQAFQRHPHGLDGLTDQGLAHLNTKELDKQQLGQFLDRVQHPDFPDLVALLLKDLAANPTSRFGSRKCHELLTADQLAELADTNPELMKQSGFVSARLVRLRPGSDEDWCGDPHLKGAYLDRLWRFTAYLDPVFNSLKAHVFYHMLAFHQEQGQYPHDPFLTYLKLPRRAAYIPRTCLLNRDYTASTADLSARYETGLGPVGNDEELVRAYLAFFLVSGDEDFSAYIDTDYLTGLHATSKLLAGAPEPEKWYAMLDDPPALHRLRDRVDIDLAVVNRRWYGANEAVTLEVDVKNVTNLVVKVFEINALNYYLQNGCEVDAAIDLDGLVASKVFKYTYADPPLHRIRRSYHYEVMDKPGIYVVDLIGNGKSSRALIRKGAPRFSERMGAAGHVFTVFAENGEPRPKATLLLDGREHRPRKGGGIVVPYTTRPRMRQALLCCGDQASLVSFQHRGESYRLTAEIQVDRESLISRATATALLRPILYLNDIPVSLNLLESPKLLIETWDRHGTAFSLEIPSLKLSPDAETTVLFEVPPDLQRLRFSLRGKVKNLCDRKTVVVTDTSEVTYNESEKEVRTLGFHLARTKQGYVLYLLGKSGEPRKDKQVVLFFHHQDFREPCLLTMQTDGRGRMELGALRNISSLTAKSLLGTHRSWNLSGDLCTWPKVVQASAQTPIRLPVSNLMVDLVDFSLLEKRAGKNFRNCRDHLSLAEGYLHIDGLPPGDYQLHQAGKVVQIRISAALPGGQWLCSDKRWLETHNRARLQITAIEQTEEELVVRLAGARPDTRVHLAGTRFVPAEAAIWALQGPQRSDPLQLKQQKGVCHYQSGRDIGDEYRYILERQYAPKRPGNMLNRPGLLLNPWATRNTQTGSAAAAPGGSYDSRAMAPSAAAPMGGRAREQSKARETGDNNLDFLEAPARLLVNQRPDKDGVLRLPLSEFQGANLVTVLALDDLDSVQRQYCLPEVTTPPRDLRLQDGLNPDEDYCEHKQTTVLKQGGRLKIVDSSISRVQGYACLDDVFQLLAGLSGNKTLGHFAFILEWPDLEPEQKRERYGEYACHELSFFIYRKDPAFFKGVVQPYLAAKKNKTFLDHYLLEVDLGAYLTPWAYARLNIVERILLSERIEGEATWTTRHVDDECDLLKPSVAEDNHLFLAALKGKTLAESTPSASVKQEAVRARHQLGGAPPVMPPDEESLGMEDLENLFLDAADEGEMDLASRGEVARAFSQMDKTEEWAENNYYHLPITRQVADLVTVNRFWRDFAHYDGKGLFLSPEFTRATANFTEVMFALSVLDLPFKAGDCKLNRTETTMEIQVETPTIFFHREIKPKAIRASGSAVSVAQNYYRHDDKQEHKGLKFISGEFLTHTIYCCHLAVTNLSTSRMKCDLLLQIPNGSLLVGNQGAVTDSRPLDLKPYESVTASYAFYFPKAGVFSHYPACISGGEELIAKATGTALTVVDQLTRIDKQSWPYLSQHGSEAQVLGYLKAHNIARLDLDKIAWRLADRGFYTQLIALLERRHIYDSRVWSYALKHDDVKRIEQCLLDHDGFLKLCGARLSSPLLTIDPVANHRYEHLTYAPLVNARNLRLGKRVRILNEAFATQYRRFLEVTTYAAPDNAALLEATSYLLLQDRVGEGLTLFKRVDPTAVTQQLQYDYLRAYTTFFSQDPRTARSIAEAYRDYPVPRWRKLFGSVLAVLDEMEGVALQLVDEKDRLQEQTALAAAQPGFEFELAGSELTVYYRNLKSCRVNYYLMDIELLFSRQPFVQQKSDHFSIIRPNGGEELTLPEGDRFCFQVAEAYRGVNAIVELVADGVRKAQASYANHLRVLLAESYGQLTVHDEEARPLPAVYVKVYGKERGGEVTFYKDGYTDHRGRFDYASLSTDDLDRVTRFSILVLAEAHGSVIQEVDPPKP